MITAGNFNPQNGINNARNSKHVVKYKSVLSPASVQFSSVAQLCLTLCDPMNRSTPGLPVHHKLLEFTQIHVH